MEDSVTETDASTQDVSAEVDVADLVTDFEDAFTSSQHERECCERDRDYYDGDQLSEDELEALKKRKQPPVISNRIGPKIDALLGYELKIRTEPKAYPRTPQHEDDANSVTDSISFVCEQNKFDTIRSQVAENLFIEGIGAATITVKTVNGQPEVQITNVPWDRFYRDPHSRQPDFCDARYMGVVLWMDEEEAIERFPDAGDIIESCYAEGNQAGDTYDDRPRLDWSDKKRHRIRVLQHRFMHKGQWWTCIFCRGGFLRDPQVSPYEDEHGNPSCDLIAVSAYVTRENERYGIVRRHISPQDEINKRRSKALHLLNVKQIIAEKGAVDDIEQTRREAAKPDGFMQPNPNMRFELITSGDLIAGQFQLLQEAKAEIDISGVNPALGGDQEAPSGRAQEVQITAGLAEQAKVFEALRQWSWEVYRQVWYRIRQYWTDQRWIRVTDDEKNLRWVTVNQPITRRDQLIEQVKAAQAQGQRVAPPNVDPNDPSLDQVVGTKNSLGELDVDIILEDAPESINLQSEQFQALVDLKKADPNAIPTKAIIQASTLRNKDQILEYIDSQSQGQVPPQVQQQMQQLQQELAQTQQNLQQSQQQLQQAKEDQATELQRQQLEAQKNNQQQSNEMQIAKYQADRKAELDKYEVDSKRQTAIDVAYINAGAKVESAAAMGAKDASGAPAFVSRSESLENT